jgi:putative component of toxin-antitoxin plasmid stabilization module
MVGFMGAVLAMDRGAGYRLYICHRGTGLLAEVCEQNQAIKNPA